MPTAIIKGRFHQIPEVGTSYFCSVTHYGYFHLTLDCPMYSSSYKHILGQLAYMLHSKILRNILQTHLLVIQSCIYLKRLPISTYLMYNTLRYIIIYFQSLDITQYIAFIWSNNFIKKLLLYITLTTFCFIYIVIKMKIKLLNQDCL